MRVFATALLLFVAVLILLSRSIERFLNRVSATRPPVIGDAARRLHAASFVADLHADSLLWSRDLTTPSSFGHVDFPRLREGGIGLQVFTIVTRFPLGANLRRTDPRFPDLVTLLVAANAWPPETWTSLEARALEQARRLEGFARRDGRVLLVRSKADLEELRRRRARDPDVLGALLGIEGAHALEHGAASLDRSFAAGVRLLGLAHFFDDAYAGSAHGLDQYGLTDAGRELVRSCESRGIVIDLAHASAKTIDDVLAMATKPVVVSHTGLRATCDNPRNLSDEQLRGIAATGGVVGIGFWATAVCGRDVAAIARAIRHGLDVVGDAHVALGSDFDGAVTTPIDARGVAAVTEALVDLRVPEPAIRRILGENALRLFRETLPAS